MLECVTLKSNHLFDGNPIYEQHKLRYESIIKRQGWDVPTVDGMEYDSYDNPAAYYLVRRNRDNEAVGVSRLYPTDRSYMLQDAFSHLVTKIEMPREEAVWEGSRFCVARHLSPDERQRIIQEIVVGYLEFGLARGIRSIVGVMYPVYWRNIFIRSGWDVEWMGDVHKSDEGHKIIAGELKISAEVLARVRKTTGIYEDVLSFGKTADIRKKAA